MERELIKTVLDFEVNGFTGAVTYIVTEMYNVMHEDGFTSIDFKEVENVTFSRDEIIAEGGSEEIKRQLKECYNITEFN
jgi:hypothetical protein